MSDEPVEPELAADESGEAEAGRPLSPMLRAWRKAMRTARKRSARKEEKLLAELAECDQAEELRECGELLKANLGEIKRGQTEVVLPDLYRAGEERLIELDPCLGPMDNARRYFKRHRKLTDARQYKENELAACRREGAELDRALAELEAWLERAASGEMPPPALVALAVRLRVHVEGLRAAPVAPEAGEGEPEAAGPDEGEKYPGTRRYRSRDGLLILVGKSAAENDHLSFRLARGNDWWFHAGGASGSHVVVKGTGGPSLRQRHDFQLPQETLLDAAHLAVHFSKLRDATRAEVTYTQAKYLRKDKRAPAGQVQVIKGKGLHVRIEPPRLARLLQPERV